MNSVDNSRDRALSGTSCFVFDYTEYNKKEVEMRHSGRARNGTTPLATILLFERTIQLIDWIGEDEKERQPKKQPCRC